MKCAKYIRKQIVGITNTFLCFLAESLQIKSQEKRHQISSRRNGKTNRPSLAGNLPKKRSLRSVRVFWKSFTGYETRRRSLQDVLTATGTNDDKASGRNTASNRRCVHRTAPHYRDMIRQRGAACHVFIKHYSTVNLNKQAHPVYSDCFACSI